MNLDPQFALEELKQIIAQAEQLIRQIQASPEAAAGQPVLVPVFQWNYTYPVFLPASGTTSFATSAAAAGGAGSLPFNVVVDFGGTATSAVTTTAPPIIATQQPKTFTCQLVSPYAASPSCHYCGGVGMYPYAVVVR